MKQLGKAIDEIRADEARRLKQDGYEPLLKHSRWCLLKRPENLTEKQTVKLSELLHYNLQSGARLLASRRLPTLLGIPIARLGREVSGRMDRPRDAFEAGAAEGSGRSLRKHRPLCSTGSAPKGPFRPASSRVLTTKPN